MAAIRAWQASTGLRFIGEGPDHLQALEPLVVPADVTGPRIHDARIAAICLSHGVGVLWTTDRDFSRFPALTTENPLPRI